MLQQTKTHIKITGLKSTSISTSLALQATNEQTSETTEPVSIVLIIIIIIRSYFLGGSV